jgi:hypothetical protein
MGFAEAGWWWVLVWLRWRVQRFYYPDTLRIRWPDGHVGDDPRALRFHEGVVVWGTAALLCGVCIGGVITAFLGVMQVIRG